MVWPRLSCTVPSLEKARVRSAPAGLPGPDPPSPASPALVERGVYVRVHPEWPECIICERKKGEGSDRRAQGLESCNWGLEASALRNSPQWGPSPRSKTASSGSTAMTPHPPAGHTEAGPSPGPECLIHSGGRFATPPALETSARASPRWAGALSLETAQARLLTVELGENRSKCPLDRWDPVPSSFISVLPKFY